jgi:Transglutaminase-like superfamily
VLEPDRRSAAVPITPPAKALLLARIWVDAARVTWALRRHSLQQVVDDLGRSTGRDSLPPAFLSRAVSRGLRIGRWQPRCLIRSLVLYRLLREQGEAAELVIGLPDRSASPDAHAWVEIGGLDHGPAPGRGPHRELTRYPRGA